MEFNELFPVFLLKFANKPRRFIEKSNNKKATEELFQDVMARYNS